MSTATPPPPPPAIADDAVIVVDAAAPSLPSKTTTATAIEPIPTPAAVATKQDSNIQNELSEEHEQPQEHEQKNTEASKQNSTIKDEDSQDVEQNTASSKVSLKTEEVAASIPVVSEAFRPKAKIAPPEIITVNLDPPSNLFPSRKTSSNNTATDTEEEEGRDPCPETSTRPSQEGGEGDGTPTKNDIASQARTPKHANKQQHPQQYPTKDHHHHQRMEEEDPSCSAGMYHSTDEYHHTSHDRHPHHPPPPGHDEEGPHHGKGSMIPPPPPHGMSTRLPPLWSAGGGYEQQHAPYPNHLPNHHGSSHPHHQHHHQQHHGAFQPHDRHLYAPSSSSNRHQQQHHHHHIHPSLPPMQVSPGGSRYYYSNANSSNSNSSNSYDPRYADFPPPQPGSYPHSRGGSSNYPPPPPPLYPPSSQPPTSATGGGYDSRSTPGAAWGPPPSFPHGRPGYDMRYSSSRGSDGPRIDNNNNAHFSRAVSNSFDRSIKSGTDKALPPKELLSLPPPPPPPALLPDSGSFSEDASWGALQQVHSVDEEEMRKRLLQKKIRKNDQPNINSNTTNANSKDDVIVNDRGPASNSSSLTNSPTEGVEGKEKEIADSAAAAVAALRKRAKPSSSLDSLSSAASTREPMDATTTNSNRHMEDDDDPVLPHPLHSSSKHEGRGEAASSPDGSAPSYDLIKCPSGSSALLLPSHQRSLSMLSLGLESKGTFSTAHNNNDKSSAMPETDADEEREGIEEDEDDDNTSNRNNRKQHNDENKETHLESTEPLTKKSRTHNTDINKKQSPLSITCSPPSSPTRKSKDPAVHQPQALYPPQHHHHARSHHERLHHHQMRSQHRHHHSSMKEDSPAVFYDKAPCYTYSMESASSGPVGPPQDGHPEEYTVPRPGSSNSGNSTITPMHVDAGPGGSSTRVVEMRPLPPGVGQMPSWEIHAQDSFGTASANGGNGGNPLMGSFSFPQEYQMLAPSESADGGRGGPMMMQPPGGHGVGMHPNQTIESRDQSFDGGHYHGGGGGGFARTDSMMSYEGRQMSFDGHGRSGYHGPFPPHAASWGSAASYPTAYGHPSQQSQRMGYHPPMMRNYSEDSCARTSPPPSTTSGMRMMPPSSFPPPPEFRAPPSMVGKGGPQNTILTSPYPTSPKAGPFGWSKEEDSRLTEIMKKYKNPRDWNPIAKDHSRGRSAKECHERWIRYLKPGVRKGQWTDHEDAVVMEVVTTSSEQPFTRWSDLAQRLPGRVGKQIRDRWVNHLNPAINHLPFSREDDLNLWEGHTQLGKRWVEISTKHFNNSRSENHIKNRWYSASFKKFISNEFGAEAYNGGKASSGDSVDGSDSISESPVKDSSSPSKKKTSKRPQPVDPSQVEAV